MSTCGKNPFILSAVIGGVLGAAAAVPLQKVFGPKPASAAQSLAAGTQEEKDAFRKLVREEINAFVEEMTGRRIQPMRTENAVQAKASSLQSITQTLRSQIELYKLQHRDEAPTLAQLNDNWSVLVQRTDMFGKPTTGREAFGPYMQSAPVNPLNGKSKLSAKDEPVSPDAGWVYEESTNRIWGVVPQNVEAQVKDSMGGDYVLGPAAKK